MASFKLIERATGREINVNVAQFLLRNEYATRNSQYGGVYWVDPDGYTTLQDKGDDIIEKIGWDSLVQLNEYYFANNPKYYLRLEKSIPTTTSPIRVFADPSLAEGVQYNIYTDNYGYIRLFHDDSTSYLENIVPVLRYRVRTYPLDEPVDIEIVPSWNMNSTGNDLYKPRIAFDFIHHQVALVSPYYFQYPSYAKGSATISSNTWLYVYPTELPRAATYTFTNTPPQLAPTTSNTYEYPSPRNWLYFPYTSQGNVVKIKNYGELSGKKVITTVQSRYIASAVPSGIITHYPTANWWLNCWGGFQYRNFDFLFDLLFDKIPTEGEDDPYPDDDDPNNPKPPDGQSPPSEGGDGDHDKDSDPIPLPPSPDFNPVGVGAINLYQMTPTTYLEFLKYLWSNVFYTAILKLFNDPIECIISTHIIGVNVPINGNDNITIGNVTAPVKANIVSTNFITVEFGSLDVTHFYGDSSDYDTVIQLYLPYFGYVTLNTYEVMGATLSLSYNIDILTGAFVALLKVKKSVDNTALDSVLYQYNGTMTYSVPIGSTNYSGITQGIINLISQQPNVSDFHVGYQRAGSLSSNTGYMSVKNAYVTILRPIHAKPNNFNHYMGLPYMGYVSLGSCSGLTICSQVWLNNVNATPEELDEIKKWLMEGVIL